MEEAKRKQIETQLRRLINAADRNSNSNKNDRNSLHLSGEVRVIRRRKGSPDRHVIGTRNQCLQSAADVG